MGDVIAAERGTREKAETEAAVRQELAALKSEVAELRAEAKVRGTVDDLQARLDQIEQYGNRPVLKAITAQIRF